jgi:hypothetical protein
MQGDMWEFIGRELCSAPTRGQPSSRLAAHGASIFSGDALAVGLESLIDDVLATGDVDSGLSPTAAEWLSCSGQSSGFGIPAETFLAGSAAARVLASPSRGADLARGQRAAQAVRDTT